MGRLLGILFVFGGLAVFLAVYTQGPKGAFESAVAHFSKPEAPVAAYEEPVRPRPKQDWWEREERTPPQGIGQRVRNRVNDAMEQGSNRVK
jgi:hypothetical protein